LIIDKLLKNETNKKAQASKDKISLADAGAR